MGRTKHWSSQDKVWVKAKAEAFFTLWALVSAVQSEEAFGGWIENIAATRHFLVSE